MTVDKRLGSKSRKLLKCSLEQTMHQKKYYQELHEASKRGEPIIWTDVATPMEIYRAMDLNVIMPLNYSAIASAKQLSSYYLDVCEERSYFRDLCRYCGKNFLGYLFDHGRVPAPYGGMAPPTVIVALEIDDPLLAIYEVAAEELKVPLFLVERVFPKNPPENIWEEHEIEPRRLNYYVKMLEELIVFLETHTGRKLNEARLRENVRIAAETWKLWHETDDLRKAIPAPISSVDHYANISAHQYMRGTQWGLEHNRKYRDEVKERVEKGLGVVEKERYRLMWDSVPVWFSPGFYNAFEDKYGAVFVWEGSYHVPKRHYDDMDPSKPLESLAACYLDYFPMCMGIPQTRAQTRVKMVKEYSIDGVIIPKMESCKLLGTSTYLKHCLQEIGVPWMEIDCDFVDIRNWDETRAIAQVSNFIETLTPRET